MEQQGARPGSKDFSEPFAIDKTVNTDSKKWRTITWINSPNVHDSIPHTNTYENETVQNHTREQNLI